MSTERKIPVGRLGRLVRLARLGAKTGAGMLLSKEATHAAKEAAEVLGTLRGLAAKVGQMASYVDGVVPEEHREAYELALRSLRAAAPTSSPAAIRALVEQQLDGPIESLFAEWQDTPFASASIGQVHQATLHDGRKVAVKVQHPGIEKAIESDLNNAGMLESMLATIGTRKFNSKAFLNEIRTRFREELDYTLEAGHQKRFTKLHGDDEHIQIPEVIEDRSAKRVLTTEFVTGNNLDEASTESEQDRRLYCETLWRFVFRGTLVGGMFNADPHPGNYLFQPKGRITFLDFGCVQPFESPHKEGSTEVHKAALRGDEKAFRKASAAFLGTHGGRHEEMALEYMMLCFQPLFKSPFRMTRPYTVQLVHTLKAFAMEARNLKDGSFVPFPANMLFMNRLQFGFYSVLAKMDVEVDYAEVERSVLKSAGLL